MKFNIMFVDDSIRVLEFLQWMFKDESYYLFVKKPLDVIEIKKEVKAAIADYETNTGIKRQAIV